MAVVVTTNQPDTLVKAIYKAIDDKHITTWGYNSKRQFTHTPPQWKDKAVFTPDVNQSGDKVTFYLSAPNGEGVSDSIYAVYHGRFIEMLLEHFDKMFSNASATALPLRGSN